MVTTRVVSIVIVALLLCGAGNALQSIRPPSGVPSGLVGEFGCALASNSRQLSIFAPSSPFTDGQDAWRVFTYTQGATPSDWTRAATCMPSSSSDGVPSSESDCYLDFNSGYVVIGEPWANKGAGRVVVSRIQNGQDCSASSVLSVGNSTSDALGSDVAIFNEWIVAIARRPLNPYVRLFKFQNSEFVLHSELTTLDFGANINPSEFGTWVDVRNSWMIIGCPVEYGDGSVLVFKYSSQSDKWALFQTLDPVAATGATSPSFGTVVAVRGPSLFVSSPGSSTSAGSVYVYKFGPHDEWQLDKILKSPTTIAADEFGRALAASDTALAISQSSTPGAEYSRVHVYRQCGTFPFALHSVILPDEEQRFDHRWSQRLAWNLNSLAIASPGLVNIWTLPPSAQCTRNTGAFPPASCCENGANVIASESGTVVISGAASTTPSFIDSPIIVAGNLKIEPPSILAVKQGITVTVDGIAAFNGKLKIQLQRPATDGQHSIPIDNLIRYSARRASFKEIEVTFETGETKCDRISAQPVYSINSLSIVITASTQTDCKTTNLNPLLPVYITLGLLTLVVIGVVVALWRFPHLRNMIATPASATRIGYKHTRLRDEDPADTEGRQLAAFQRYSNEAEEEEEDNSLGIAIDDEDNDEELH